MKRWGGFATEGPAGSSLCGRQRLLYPRRGRRLPPDGCPLLHHHPPAQKPAQSHRGDTRRCWTPIPYWMDGPLLWPRPPTPPSRVSGRTGGLIIRRVQPTPGSQLALFATYSYHGSITDRDGETLELEADHRRHAEIRTRYATSSTARAEPPPLGPLRRQRRLAGGTGDGPQPGPLDSPPVWVSRPSTKTLRRRSSPWPDASPARHAALHLPQKPSGNPVQSRLGPAASHPLPACSDPTSPQTRVIPVRESSLLRILSPSRASQLSQAAIGGPVRRLKSVR